MKVKDATQQKRINSKKLDFKLEQAAIKTRLKEKFGDRFKAVKKGDSTVVISKEAYQKSQEAAKNGIKTDLNIDSPNSEETKDRLRGLLSSGTFSFNDKERSALSEILG